MLLDFGAQPLMLGKIVVDGPELIDADLDPSPYQILTSMGGSKKTQRLTKQAQLWSKLIPTDQQTTLKCKLE